MSPENVQLTILAAAYAVAALLVVASTVASSFVYRASRKLDLRRSAENRLTILESDLEDIRAHLKKLQARQTTVLREARRAEEGDGTEAQPGEQRVSRAFGSREELMEAWRQGKLTN